MSDTPQLPQPDKGVKKNPSTPAGWHICRNDWQRSRTPVPGRQIGQNRQELLRVPWERGAICFLRSGQIVQLKDLGQSGTNDIAPSRGCASAVTRLYKYATTLGWMIFSHLLPVGGI